ncbi:hypothetical protein MASR2M74_02140 [Paracoccaceae bacterium]
MNAIRTFLAATAAALSLASPLAANATEHPEGIHIHDAYARASAQSGAVFFMIHNNTGADITITGAQSDAAEMVALHTHKEDANGVMQMVEIEAGVPVPFGEMHEFKRGADHVMLMGLKAPLKDGDIVTVTLSFDGAEPVTFEAAVDNNRKPEDGMGEMDHSQMDHSKMDHSQMGSSQKHGVTAALDTTGMTDDAAIVAIMKAQFDTPENPLTVEPVVVEGEHALASWAQGDKGGRALLERRDGVWTIVLCGGADLRMPAFLTEHGVSSADALSKMFNTAEDALGAEKVSLYSSFEGVVMISEPAK